jgi:hypothetical protein
MSEADILELSNYKPNTTSLYRSPNSTLSAVESADACYWGVLSGPTKMEMKVSRDTVDYIVDNRFSHLLRSYMVVKIPEVRVKTEFRGKVRIAWTHNLLHNITMEGTFVHENVPWMKWDSVYLDHHYNVFEESDNLKSSRYLEKWRERQPELEVPIHHPWFYSTISERAWPCVGNSFHRYRLKLKIASLIRIQVMSEQGVWVPYLDEKISRYLDVSDDATIAVPELWGEYSIMGDEDKDREKKCHATGENPIIQYFHTIVSADSDEFRQYGQNLAVDLKVGNARVSSILWSAENIDSKNEHNHSNYSTSIDSVYAGSNPIAEVSLHYLPAKGGSNGVVFKFDKMSSVHFSGDVLGKRFAVKAGEPGIHAYTYSWDPDFYDADFSQHYGHLKPRLIVRLADGDPMSENPGVLAEENPYGPRFRLRCRMRVVREWKIYKDEKGISKMEVSSC